MRWANTETQGADRVDADEPNLSAKLATSGLIARAERRPLHTLGAAVMAEPSSAAAGGFALWKVFGGLAAVAAVGAFLASIVAMCMMTPRSPREWAVGLISTVMSSLGGGAYAILKLGLHRDLPADPVSLYIALIAGLGIVFACGLPGWALVRAMFTWLERRKDKDLGELVNDARRVIKP